MMLAMVYVEMIPCSIELGINKKLKKWSRDCNKK